MLKAAKPCWPTQIVVRPCVKPGSLVPRYKQWLLLRTSIRRLCTGGTDKSLFCGVEGAMLNHFLVRAIVNNILDIGLEPRSFEVFLLLLHDLKMPSTMIKQSPVASYSIVYLME